MKEIVHPAFESTPSSSPSLPSRPLTKEDSQTLHDVLIVGGGPVGLLLACLLGNAGLKTLLLEKRTKLPEQSMAIGITPPSLGILDRLGLANQFIDAGIRIQECHLHGNAGYLGRVTFRGIPAEHQFVLSLPQSRSVEFLFEAASHLPTVSIRSGVEVTDVRQDERGCFTSESGGMQICSRFVIACDGTRSTVRRFLPVKVRGQNYKQHFVMGDFSDESGLEQEAHLFFTKEGSVESFPLPGGLRRWIVQTDDQRTDFEPGFLGARVQERVGIPLNPSLQLNQNCFTPQWFNCKRYHHGRIVLCGDAAHAMSPVGGQGMNTGFADAEFLRDVLVAIILGGAKAQPLIANYDDARRQAAASAIRRADWGMWLGTWRGRSLSMLRDFILRDILCRPPVAKHLGPFYAMLTLPNRSLHDLQPLHSFLQSAQPAQSV